ncbi:hypothetical protein TIFTF001_004742 [Ficus carica]|uniref:Uncharacterized protein n=1 Tax=Ficus carica TaxID=3494 RepID=A0AA87ZW68_FICCA|nr:hypothetical protein TIFTF001_004742 [Ficus carica]
MRTQFQDRFGPWFELDMAGRPNHSMTARQVVLAERNLTTYVYAVAGSYRVGGNLFSLEMAMGVTGRWDLAAFSLEMVTRGRGVAAGGCWGGRGREGDLFLSEMATEGCRLVGFGRFLTGDNKGYRCTATYLPTIATKNIAQPRVNQPSSLLNDKVKPSFFATNCAISPHCSHLNSGKISGFLVRWPPVSALLNPPTIPTATRTSPFSLS